MYDIYSLKLPEFYHRPSVYDYWFFEIHGLLFSLLDLNFHFVIKKVINCFFYIEKKDTIHEVIHRITTTDMEFSDYMAAWYIFIIDLHTLIKFLISKYP